MLHIRIPIIYGIEKAIFVYLSITVGGDNFVGREDFVLWMIFVIGGRGDAIGNGGGSFRAIDAGTNIVRRGQR